MVKTLTEVVGSTPEGYADCLRSSDLFQVEKRFGYHSERINAMLLDDVAETLPDGVTVFFPLGQDRIDRPYGIKFRFERMNFIVLLPEAMTTDTRVFICPLEAVSDQHIQRAAETFAHHFNTEYRKLYYTSIRISKIKNGVTE